jgi:hypothetical protein
MSMSTQHGGGNRKPSTKPVAGAKPKQGGDEEEAADEELALDATDSLDADDSSASDADDSSADDSDADDSSADDSSASDAADSPAESRTRARVTKKAAATADKARTTKASPRKSATTRTGATKSGSRPAGSRPAGKAAGRRVAPVKVQQDRNWGPIALFGIVGLVALAIIGFAGYQVYMNGLTWQERADKIDGIIDYHKTDPGSLDYQSHTWGPIKYKYNPPSGGTHNPNWMRCLGDVYPAPIAQEHAVHSQEHGAVWITYNPSLPADQVEALAKKVRGNDYMLMSPYTGLDKPISLQAWGFQLKVDNADDGRIDDFIKALRQNASLEAGTPCSSGDIITETGTVPHDLGKDGTTQMGGN